LIRETSIHFHCRYAAGGKVLIQQTLAFSGGGRTGAPVCASATAPSRFGQLSQRDLVTKVAADSYVRAVAQKA